MLVITADDYGKNHQATDNILQCYRDDRITSASAMVFMVDSERAASSASGIDLEIGLHMNYTLPFTARNTPSKLREQQNRLVSYLTKHRLSLVLYNPFLTDAFNFVFFSQMEEFLRLYSRFPDFYNGHNHLHLCANMLASDRLPKGARLRRTYTFERGEKGGFNRLYRRILNFYISRRFISTTTFFSIDPVQNYERLKKIITRADKEDVEIGVHPENDEEKGFLLGDQFLALIKSVPRGPFLSLPAR